MNAPSGNKNVIKSGLNLSPDSLERGYRAYAAIRDEEAVKSLVEKEWKDRYNAETEQALEIQKANDFGTNQLTLSRNCFPEARKLKFAEVRSC